MRSSRSWRSAANTWPRPGRFKPDPAAVSAPARVDAIIVKVRADAEAQGLDPTVAERTYRAMIAAFEDYERAEWTRRQEASAGALAELIGGRALPGVRIGH